MGAPAGNVNLMAKANVAIQNTLVNHWNGVRDHLRRVNSGIQFQPNDGYTIFQPDYTKSSDEILVFKIAPVVVNLPERGDKSKSELFVVAEGELSFNGIQYANTKRLVSSGFATHVGYFRQGSSELQHVYGVHYDFDLRRPAHPVFHAQMTSFGEPFVEHVRQHFSINLPLDDRVKGMLQNVRLPIAQLDFFSLIIQLAADHLMWEHSGDEEKKAFNDLLQLDGNLVGASASAPWLCIGTATPCHRALHWYAPLQSASSAGG